MNMKIGIVILNYNDVISTIGLITNIYSYRSIDHIVVVDNGSTDNSMQELSKLKEKLNFFLIKSDKNGGYSYGNNLGLRYLVEVLKDEIVIIANPDVYFQEDIIDQISKCFSVNANCGLTCPIMLDKNGHPMRMWLKLPKYINSIFDCFFIGRQLNKLIRRTKIVKSEEYQKVEIIPGSLMAFRSSVLKNIKYLDENVFLYYEENIIGEKLKNMGIETLLITNCSYIHNHSVSIKKNLSIINAYKYNLKSKFYYENTYHHIGRLKKSILIKMLNFGVKEMSVILSLKSLLLRK